MKFPLSTCCCCYSIKKCVSRTILTFVSDVPFWIYGLIFRPISLVYLSSNSLSYPPWENRRPSKQTYYIWRLCQLITALVQSLGLNRLVIDIKEKPSLYIQYSWFIIMVYIRLEIIGYFAGLFISCIPFCDHMTLSRDRKCVVQITAGFRLHCTQGLIKGSSCPRLI